MNLSLTVVKVNFANKSITKGEEVECYSPIAAWANVDCPNCWVYLNLHALGFIESVYLVWSFERRAPKMHHPYSTDKRV